MQLRAEITTFGHESLLLMFVLFGLWVQFSVGFYGLFGFSFGFFGCGFQREDQMGLGYVIFLLSKWVFSGSSYVILPLSMWVFI